MSADLGGLSFDRRPLVEDAEPTEPADDDRGAWSEELEYSVYADTSMTIPGKGTEGENCGTWLPVDFCDGCADVGMAQNRCGRRSCPDCSNIWTGERTEGIVRRMIAARHVEEKGVDRRSVHCVASPEEGDIRTLQDVYNGYRDAYELARERGVRGGVCIFHGYRPTDEAKAEFRAEDPDNGIWKWINEHARDWRSLTYWSPHWHVIGLARDIEADEGEDGWRFRRLSSHDPMNSLTDRDAYDSLAGNTRYLLSHATYETDSSRDCVRWFGSLATTQFQPEEELSEGALDVIDRKVEEWVGPGRLQEGDGDVAGVEDETEPCECCGATSRSAIWEAGAALADKGWCDRIGREAERTLLAAFEWRLGQRPPPPGLKNPRTEAEAEEALQELI